jgi:iron complex outermembrane receptor protein
MQKYTSTSKFNLTLLSIAMTSIIAVSSQATAAPVVEADENSSQESQGSLNSIEKIMVTATRRVKSIQDVGVSINAFSGDQLREQNTITFDDIGVQTPGLQFTSANGSGIAGLISIRGVAQNDFAGHLEGANALYVDDVYRPSVSGNLQSLFDVQRVEVLKGPQGTLFGRNSTGGLIHIITEDPTLGGVEGYASGTLGQFGEIVTEGAINIPLSDTTAARIAVFKRDTDGFVDNEFPGNPDSLDDDTLSVRAKFLFEPNSDLRIKLQLESIELDEVDTSSTGFAAGGEVGPDGLGIFNDSGLLDNGYTDIGGDPFTRSTNYVGTFDRTDQAAILDVQYEFDQFSVTSVTALSKHEDSYSEDNDGTPDDITVFRQGSDQETFSQELRLSFDTDTTINTFGFFYLNVDGKYIQGFDINNLFFGGNQVPIGASFNADYTVETDSWSIFWQSEYSLSEKMSLTTGLRYTEDEKEYLYNNVGAPPIPGSLAEARTVADEHTEDGISARLQLDYSVSNDWLLFTAYNRGYKAFNYNAGFSGAAPVDGVRFDGETLNSFEVGSKLDFSEGQGRFNISAFYYKYTDYQAFDQRGTDFILSNTDASMYGADADFTYNFANGINFHVGLALLNTTVKDIPVAGQLLEKKAPQSPDMTLNFTLSRDFEIGEGYIRAGVDGSYTDNYFSQLTNAQVTEVGDFWLINSRVSYFTASEAWEFSMFVRNLFDEEATTYAYDITFPGLGLVKQTYSPPRTAGLEVRYKFF